MSEKQIALNLDLEKVEKEVDEMAKRMIKDRLDAAARIRVAELFYDPKNPPYGHKLPFLGVKTNADTGYLHKLVEDTLTEVSLDPKWQTYAKKVYDDNFERFVKEAAERKARHDANKTVFANRGERKKIDGEN